MLPAILGSLIYVFGRKILPEIAAMLIAITFIVTVRILAVVFKWNLPIPKREDSPGEDSTPAGKA